MYFLAIFSKKGTRGERLTDRKRRTKGDRVVLIAGIIAVVVLCICAELETGDPLIPLKLVAMYLIGLMCGVKGLARFLPLPSH